MRIARDLIAQAPRAADAWQLLGMCLADTRMPGEAERAFERALALAPGNATVLRNYATSFARLGKGLRADTLYESAVPVLRKALALAPDLASTWVDLGVALRMSGRIDEALTAYRRAESLLDPDSADSLAVTDAITGVLADSGRTDEALVHAQQLVARHPRMTFAHETLSRLLREHGAEQTPDEDPFGSFLAAASAQPDNHELQLGLARMLLSAERADEALPVLDRLRGALDAADPLLDWFTADALDMLHMPDRAARLYAAADRSGLGKMPAFLNAYARHAFRTGTFDLAEALAGRAIGVEPHNQEAWAHRGTAWRLAGDAREDWLCDYDRLVAYVEVPPPDGYPDASIFLDALTEALARLHGASRAPISQSVRGGTQTAGQLFGRDNAVIQATERATRAAVETWLAALPKDLHHPFLGRRMSSVRWAGSWSVRLKASGRHSNHIHPQGWASSAFHVSVPSGVRDANSPARDGWLQFGAPLESLGLDLSPRRMIRPAPGYLALFPSYMWHGTVPFDAPESRLTIAFDMQPKEKAD